MGMDVCEECGAPPAAQAAASMGEPNCCPSCGAEHPPLPLGPGLALRREQQDEADVPF